MKKIKRCYKNTSSIKSQPSKCNKQILAPLLLFVVLIFFPWQAINASEPLSINHTLQSYSVNGLDTTVTLNLEIKNNTSEDINNIVIGLADPENNRLFIGNKTIEPLSVAILSHSTPLSMSYTITASIVGSQEVISTSPIFWEIKYSQSQNEENGIMIVSNNQ